MGSRAVLSWLLAFAVTPSIAQPAKISDETLRLAERCGEVLFYGLYSGYQASVACKQGDSKAQGCGEFMTLTSTRNASRAEGECIERLHPKVAWHQSPVNGEYIEGYSPAEAEVFFWLSSTADCKAFRMARQALQANPDDLAARETLNQLRAPSPWPPKCDP
jgi:hypothetical protein